MAKSSDWPDWRTRIRTAGQSMLAPMLGRRASTTRRRLHAYAIGLPRSGTHSLAAMFAGKFRAAHEPALVDSLAHLLRYNAGDVTADRMRAILRWRDRRLDLELEAAHYLHHVAPLLVDEFPQARFVLTLRDPIAWVESEINQNVRSSDYAFWRALEEQRYGRYGTQFPDAERDLAKVGCAHPLASYFRYWNDHIRSVLEAVPADRLLTLRTNELDERLPELAQFLGVDVGQLDRTRSRSGVGDSQHFDLRASIDAGYLEGLVAQHCGDLANEWFPERA